MKFSDKADASSNMISSNSASRLPMSDFLNEQNSTWYKDNKHGRLNTIKEEDSFCFKQSNHNTIGRKSNKSSKIKDTEESRKMSL